MKGVILAGGNGSRLMPLTKAVNKHLLPVGPYPMIYWSIMKLEEAGIKDILLISQKEHMPQFFKLLGNGKSLASQSLIRFSQPHQAFQMGCLMQNALRKKSLSFYY